MSLDRRGDGDRKDGQVNKKRDFNQSLGDFFPSDLYIHTHTHGKRREKWRHGASYIPRESFPTWSRGNGISSQGCCRVWGCDPAEPHCGDGESEAGSAGVTPVPSLGILIPKDLGARACRVWGCSGAGALGTAGAAVTQSHRLRCLHVQDGARNCPLPSPGDTSLILPN